MGCECCDYRSPSPAIWVVSVVVISLGPSPAIWIVSVVVISLGPSMPYGLCVWWSSDWAPACNMDCKCGEHQFRCWSCHWIMSVAVISLRPSPVI